MTTKRRAKRAAESIDNLQRYLIILEDDRWNEKSKRILTNFNP
jgi:hypothetical protein